MRVGPEHHDLGKFTNSDRQPGTTLCMAPASSPIILAAYTCGTCETQGRDREVSPGLVLCWNCGGPALITARVADSEASRS